MIKPEDYTNGSAEEALAKFVMAWKARKWREMADLCQITWIRHQADPIREMRERFAWMRLNDAVIEAVEEISPVQKWGDAQDAQGAGYLRGRIVQAGCERAMESESGVDPARGSLTWL